MTNRGKIITAAVIVGFAAFFTYMDRSEAYATYDKAVYMVAFQAGIEDTCGWKAEHSRDLVNKFVDHAKFRHSKYASIRNDMFRAGQGLAKQHPESCRSVEVEADIQKRNESAKQLLFRAVN